eukprot:4169671-Amphidinium_carterae.1
MSSRFPELYWNDYAPCAVLQFMLQPLANACTQSAVFCRPQQRRDAMMSSGWRTLHVMRPCAAMNFSTALSTHANDQQYSKTSHTSK